MSGTAETTYYSNDRVTVTNARFMVDGETHAISGITSVKLGVKKPNRILPAALMIFELLALCFQRTHYTVTLASASGEHRALKSKVKPFVSEVVEAINQAIVRRA
ncbi:DUF6232 family protein [Janthinobacterium sp.]|uniref:DUF6232 family protein n=1 Tax=Janthinobacterium sp. TaxID=1871054 RepID=UPI00258CC939|nr:DUF6232 family protein [Janthinobacterium sp.]MCX7289640.1 DUF6232 family protein [Janthinobacterium sp.]